jgi:CO/xanthine dehydrogenase FAD-binding subunit
MASGFTAPSFEETSRVKIPELSVKDRISDIDIEDVSGIDLGRIGTEAGRCFNCGCLAVNPSDIGVALVALDARIITTKRSIDARNFFTSSAMSSTVLEADELITEVQIPKLPKGSGQNFLKFTLRKPIDFAIVSVASVITIADGKCKDARIVMGSVAPVPVHAKQAEEFMTGKTVNEANAIKAGELAAEGARPLRMNAYKIEILKSLVKKAVLEMP